MNTHDEIMQAIDDFQAGRMGTIPAVDLSAGGATGSSTDGGARL